MAAHGEKKVLAPADSEEPLFKQKRRADAGAEPPRPGGRARDSDTPPIQSRVEAVAKLARSALRREEEG